ncbi:thiol:disulfide interchange protein [Thalassotalea loyana]|uniref:Thiol:disulfide interchange protein n=1 Tax=Thalassotalea loyana TaxID=280483 RepID=A0ABQ6HG56_9GAMM|nr:thiol:disulfide interchange protein DsbA/DsbL [Thalassotalea loyana]GLX87072.1 thiol:disulfide interchange protein [Thalassotalea loyana]
MRTLIALLFCLALPTLPVEAAKFTEGDYYVTLASEPSKKMEITEYFSFYCPACFKQEPFMNELKASMPEGAVFRKNHVDGMPKRDMSVEHSLTKALVTAQHLKSEDKLVPAIFNYIHVKGADFSNDNDIRNLFLRNGVSAKDFDKAFASFSVNVKAKQMQKNTQAIRAQGHRAVPTLIINNKYKPVLDNIKSYDEYKELVLFLLNKTA